MLFIFFLFVYCIIVRKNENIFSIFVVVCLSFWRMCNISRFAWNGMKINFMINFVCYYVLSNKNRNYCWCWSDNGAWIIGSYAGPLFQTTPTVRWNDHNVGRRCWYRAIFSYFERGSRVSIIFIQFFIRKSLSFSLLKWSSIPCKACLTKIKTKIMRK